MPTVHGVWTKYLVTAIALGASSQFVSSKLAKYLLMYGSLVNGFICALFVSRVQIGAELFGKDPATGAIPLWSYVLWSGFHVPTHLYTWAHQQICASHGVPVATEVLPGWWIGGRYGHELNKTWAGVVDLTTEFAESCRGHTASYKLIPVWDGTPPNPREIEEAAQFAVRAHESGDVLVHCAHGRGRSTTVMVACLVRAGLFNTWEEAFEACKKERPVVKLNSKMQSALANWAVKYN